MKTIALVFHSGFGHTAYAASKVQTGLLKSGKHKVLMLELGSETESLDLIGAADAVVWGSPTYMGSVSAVFKKFMESTSQIWMSQGWANKLAAGFTVSGSPSGDKLSTLQSLSGFSLQHGMIWVGYNRIPETYSGMPAAEARNQLGSFTGLMLQALPVDPKDSFSPGDVKSAIDFGERVSEVLSRMQ